VPGTEGFLKSQAFLPLGGSAVRILFDTAALRGEALRRLVLRATWRGACPAEVEFLRDRSLETPSPIEVSPNSIAIVGSKDPRAAGPVTLHYFGEFRVTIVRPGPAGGRVVVRYPRKAPPAFLLDDVLLAALQPAIVDAGGFLLHAACVAGPGGALALLGGTGAGKSTTAFNLGRFGFRGITDDAVLVTPDGRGFRAWPLSREVSLRTTSFRFLSAQGVDLRGRRRDGRKFFFPRKASATGSPLRHLGLLRATGEAATEIRRLSPAEAEAELARNPRHFHLLPAEGAAGIAADLARGDVAVHLVRLGTDLDAQGAAFCALFAPGKAVRRKKAVAAPGRTEKLALLRSAFSSPGREPLADLVPLLADFDITVVATALSFFENHPLSRLRPLGEPARKFPSAASLRVADRVAPWVRAGAYAAGVRALRERADPDYVAQHAAAWILAAPVLAPFLGRGAADSPAGSKPVPIDDVAPAIDRVRRGAEPSLSARVPLCRIPPADAAWLLDNRRFPGGDPGTEDRRHDPEPFPDCRRCALRTLTLCGGGYVA
jgi:hypothetical protein